MVKRCAFGVCNSDDRYPDRVQGVFFIPFPKPKTNLERCLKWIKACNRPHDQLNTDKITKNTFVCSKHFYDKSGPSLLYPDPLPDLPSASQCDRLPLTPIRQPQKRRKVTLVSPSRKTTDSDTDLPQDAPGFEDNAELSQHDVFNSAVSQTEAKWIDPLEMIKLSSENEELKKDVATLSLQVEGLNRKDNSREFSIDHLQDNADLFKYYTAFTSEQFNAIYNFLVPNDEISISFPSNRQKDEEKMKVTIKHQLLLTIMKLRHDFDYSDLGYRFGLRKQTVSTIFTHWINYMYLRFDEVSIWPSRDVIYEHMPEQYQEEFPTTFAILDCTEIKICKPSSLKAQSQTYSDYKSTNTLKSLVACDPRGSIIYTSMLFAGAISDKEICLKSGCQEMLKQLVEAEYLKGV